MLSRRCAGPGPGEEAVRQRAAFDVFADKPGADSRTVPFEPLGTMSIGQSAIAFRTLAA